MKIYLQKIVLTTMLLLVSKVFVYGQGSHSPIEIREMDGQKALVIRADIPMSAMGEKIGEIYGKLFAYTQQNSIVPAGAPFAVYYSWEPNGNIVFEAGLPVASPVSGSGEIEYKEYPSMKTAFTLYTGSYENFQLVYSDMQKYIEENKLEATGITWEVYLTDPSVVKDQNMNQTLIYFQLK